METGVLVTIIYFSRVSALFNFNIKNTMNKHNYLYILCNGRAAAIDKKNGEIKWEVKLNQYLSRKVGLTFGQIHVEDDKLYIGSTGVLICLNAKDGSLRWTNELKGWGYHHISMANAGSDGGAASLAASDATAAVLVATG
jgi:outer membrane protein assembly factor BamB